MIRVSTGSRLHFGLFSVPAEQCQPWLSQEGEPTLPQRIFGGVGLMVERPGLQVSAEFLSDCQPDQVEGPFASRGYDFIAAYRPNAGMLAGVRLRIESEAREHTGLGVGTQLGLAVLSAIEGEQSSRPDILARFIDRGRRSAIGIYGFELGGFLVEGGRAPGRDFAPLLVRYDFPKNWRILLITPHGIQGTHGRPEVEAFATLANRERANRATDSLCRLVLLGMCPALIEGDLQVFGEAVYDFNRHVGEMFRPAQGGVYAHPCIEEIVKLVRETGTKGVGQSSWGPTTFAIVPQERAAEIRAWLIKTGKIAPEEIVITEARNRGAVVSGEV